MHAHHVATHCDNIHPHLSFVCVSGLVQRSCFVHVVVCLQGKGVVKTAVTEGGRH